MKSAINCQSKASLQSSAIESKHITISTSVHLNSLELHACNHYPSARRDMTSHYTHTIVEYSFQPQYYILSQHCSCEIHNECVI